MRNLLTALLSVIAVVSGNVEELDDKFKDYLKHELWLVEFYAPWCAYCHTFEPTWHEVGAELKSMGSPVNVGKIDTTVHTSIASEFNIRGYPTIKLFKGELSFDYKGPRTKDAIIEFTNRVSGPVLRPLSSVQLFQHVMSHHDLIFVYIGRESFLKKEYYKAATEYIVHTYFFTASEEVLPKAVTLQDVPAVAVFKDRTYYLYNEFLDGDLSSWINRERFPSYFQIDSFSLYQMGELSKLVALAVVDEKNPSEESVRYKTLMETLSTEYRDHYKSDYQFGFMDGNEYINGLIMGEVEMPFIIVLNMTIDGYCLPESKIETIEDLLRFLNSVLDGSAKLLGGNGFLQHAKRSLYKAKSTVVSMFQAAPFFSCFVFGLPVGIAVLVIWATCTAVPADDEKPVEGATASPVLDAHGKKAIELQPDSTEKTSEAKKED
ncbi:protein disulfide-isomerase TMX3-like isoform X1 [Sinocyclocheilus grahami]|uniref:protein disulfide-isomerase TMX3-like isoform X1 n=1 Tax=Sinocyclocheilus grahami TaxID=75366 RepID=UPI0007AD0C9D|nr:PREDICTED: protein disulfide-isomerase TMX3-like isoform X1 [Sinocyclocheilus grahami]